MKKIDFSDFSFIFQSKKAKKGQFWKCGIFSKIYITIRNIILGHFQSKLVIQIASKVQKTHFQWFYVIFSTFNPCYPILGTFGQYAIFTKNYITIRNIILGHVQSKLVLQKSKNHIFSDFMSFFRLLTHFTPFWAFVANIRFLRKFI